MISVLRGLLGLTAPKGAGLAAEWRSSPITPESLMTQPMGVDRQIGSVGEIGMGGPSVWSVLLADGAILGGVCGAVRTAGALRTALGCDRQGLTLQIYDAQAQVIYTLTDTWRISTEDLDALVARSPTTAEPLLRKACQHAATTVRLHTVHGLRLPIDAGSAPEPVLTRTLSSGRRLEARLLLPADLRATIEVANLLRSPPYALVLDGVTTGVHVTGLEDVIEGPGQTIVLPGVRLDADARVLDGLWHIWGGDAWHAAANYAQRPFDGGGAYTPYFLTHPQLGENGQLRFALETLNWGPEGQTAGEPAPPDVELKVSWRAAPLRLATQGPQGFIDVPWPTSSKR